MPDIGQNIMELVNRGMEAIGSKASALAANTKQKVNELAAQNRRNEAFGRIGQKVFELWKYGVVFPAELTQELEMILELDQQLTDSSKEAEDIPDRPLPTSDILNETGKAGSSDDQTAPVKDIAGPTSAPGLNPEDHPTEERQTVAEEEPETDETFPVSPLSSAINDLFDSIPQVEKMADRVNSSLDEMGEQLKNFSDSLGKQISETADELSRDGNRK